MKVLTVIGTRPEAIKMAPVVHELKRHAHRIDSKVCVTGQHREMLDPMLELFGIDPSFDLDVMRPGQSMADVTCAVLTGMTSILQKERPDWVLVQGDTTTVMATSMAAYWQKINVGHVEAGLRTFDKYAPFPEEVNRRMAGVIADVHFAPTRWAALNLHREGVPGENVKITGNTVIDALQDVAGRTYDPSGTQLGALGLRDDERTVLVTAHRQENFGDGMHRICAAVRELAERHGDVRFVYPVHFNPKARAAAFEHLADLPNVSLIDPLDYEPLVWLLKRSHLVITDSGGLQEEAAGMNTPVLVLRETTERPEGVEAGIARLVGTNHAEIVDVADRLLQDDRAHAVMADVPCPYGDGRAARRIVATLMDHAGMETHAGHTEQPWPQHPLDELLTHATPAPDPRHADRPHPRFGRRRTDRQEV